jgi:hypothetical protein
MVHDAKTSTIRSSWARSKPLTILQELTKFTSLSLLRLLKREPTRQSSSNQYSAQAVQHRPRGAQVSLFGRPGVSAFRIRRDTGEGTIEFDC